MLETCEISRILSITAHPDDVDFAAAGTVARWTDAGIEVVHCVVTDGDAGGFDEDFPREEMPALRRAEQVAAAKCVGVTDVRFLGYVDVTETFPRKIAALRAHESQITHMEDLTERIRTRLTLVAGQAGLPGGRLAEGFRVLDTA